GISAGPSVQKAAVGIAAAPEHAAFLLETTGSPSRQASVKCPLSPVVTSPRPFPLQTPGCQLPNPLTGMLRYVHLLWTVLSRWEGVPSLKKSAANRGSNPRRPAAHRPNSCLLVVHLQRAVLLPSPANHP